MRSLADAPRLSLGCQASSEPTALDPPTASHLLVIAQVIQLEVLAPQLRSLSLSVCDEREGELGYAPLLTSCVATCCCVAKKVLCKQSSLLSIFRS
jgi:hypothetical protein